MEKKTATITPERAQELNRLQQNGMSWHDIFVAYGVTRYQIKRQLDLARYDHNVNLSAVSLQSVAEAIVDNTGEKFFTTDSPVTEGRFVKPRFIPDCLACHKQTASLQYSGYFCSLECAAIWALDYLQTSTTPEWCPFCKAWLKVDMSLLTHIYAMHPLIEKGETDES